MTLPSVFDDTMSAEADGLERLPDHAAAGHGGHRRCRGLQCLGDAARSRHYPWPVGLLGGWRLALAHRVVPHSAGVKAALSSPSELFRGVGIVYALHTVVIVFDV